VVVTEALLLVQEDRLHQDKAMEVLLVQALQTIQVEVAVDLVLLEQQVVLEVMEVLVAPHLFQVLQSLMLAVVEVEIYLHLRVLVVLEVAETVIVQILVLMVQPTQAVEVAEVELMQQLIQTEIQAVQV